MKCPKCQFENPTGMKFCVECGAKLETVCPKCNFPNSPEFKFCGECGHDLSLPSEPSPKEPSLDEKLAKIQRYLPKGLTEKILAQRGKIEGERKQVTVIFCDMEGFTLLSERLGPEEAYSVMDQVYELLIHKVHEYEGTVNEMTGDGIVALFGAPIALEDAPQRAIRSGFAIHREMARFSDKIKQERKDIRPLKMRIGINTGPVIVGTLGNDLRVEFKAVGDTVNLASRMQELAEPGTTYVTEETFRLTEGLFRFEALGEKAVKGREEPVTIYRAIAPSTRRTRFDVSAERGLTPFVGRERELELLLDGLDRSKAGRGQAFSIMAEAGVGKSRLLYEFRKAVANEDVTFLEGRCLSYSRGVAYHPIIDILKANFDLQEGDGDLEIREKVKRGLKILGTDEASILPYLLELLSVKDSGIDKIPMSPEVKKDRVIEALRGIVLKGSEIRALIMAFEDLHWIDKSSEDHLKHLLESIPGARVLLIFTYRPEFVHTWGAKSYHSQVMLNRLSNRESLMMVSHLLGTEEFDKNLEEFILEKTEGVPFFIEELVKSLKDLKIIERKDDRYHLVKDIKEVVIPATVQDVIMARVDSLAEETKGLLQTASAVGREFSYDLIKRVAGLAEQELLSQLSGLKDSELLYERGIYPQSTYLFKHALTQEVAYNSLLLKRSKEIHEEIGKAIEALYPDRLEEHYELLAYHYSHSGNTDKAVEYLSQAGDRARGLYAHQEAIDYYQRSLALLKEQGEHEQAARTLMKLGLTYHNAFDFRRAHQAYEEGLILWQRAGEVEPAVSLPSAPHALRVFWDEPRTLDATRVVDVYAIRVMSQLFSRLVELSPEMDVVPDVAQTWEVSEGGRKYVFHLREDARWSDGTPVTAEDFAYAWRRVLDPATGSTAAGLLYDIKGARAFHQGEVSDPGYVGVHALDEHTLVVELKEPTSYFLQLLAYAATAPVPRHVVETYGEAWMEVDNIVTNGPFRLESWQRGQSMVLVRNPEYRGRLRGNVQQIDLFALERSAALKMYEDDTLDVLEFGPHPPPEMDRVRQRHAGEYLSVPWLATIFVAFDTSRPPFDDARVRQAFVLATDRQTLGDGIWRGYVFPATGGFIPPGMPGHSVGIGLSYDPQQARQLMAEAGYPDGRGFPVVDALTPHEHEPLSKHLRAQWQENLGVEITWQPMEHGAFVERVSRESPSIFLARWIADYPDPDNFLRVGPAIWLPGWGNETYAGLVEEARRSMDQEKRMDLYKQADKILVEEAAIMPLNYVRLHLLIKPWVKKHPTSATTTWWFWKDVIIEPH
ncbi:MAG: AAA family ATPase [Proteobacteria bacterium]|nr:AAA family ATPase [Pseudomonadota bacterium]